MTRFEGYILTLSVIAGLFLCNVSDAKNAFKRALKEKKVLLSFFTAFLLVEFPYIIFRNPFTSRYFDETSQRGVTIQSFIIFAISFLFIFGITNAFAFFIVNIPEVPRILRMNTSLFVFLGLEILLAIFWPAAIPRLLVPIIPYISIFLATSISKYFDHHSQTSAKKVLIFSMILLLVYLISQYVFKLQFLVSIKYLFILVLALQIPLLYFVYKFNFKFFVGFASISMFVWLCGSILVHKDIYTTIKSASSYAAQNLQGVIGYNDVSSVSDWYLNYSNGRVDTTGVFYNYSKKGDLDQDKLIKKNLDFLILTNEHNTDTKLDIQNRPYLVTVKVFSTNINGKDFWTQVLKVNKTSALK